MAVIELKRIESPVVRVLLDSVIVWLVGVLDWISVSVLYIRESIQPVSVKVIEYQGGEALFPSMEVLHVQPVLISVVGEKKAIIIQKIYEWCLVNQKKGSHQYGGATWTYGSHDDWYERHFSWMNKRYVGKLLAELVADGFLVSTNAAPFCYKNQYAYRVNHLKIMDSVSCQKVTGPLSKSDIGSVKNHQELCQKVTPNNVFKTSKSTQFIKQSETATTDARAEGQPQDIGGDGVQSDSDSGIFESGISEPVTDTQADFEGRVLEDGVITPPGCAVPPSFFVDLPGLMPKVAQNMVTRYGLKRCEAVVNWIVRHDRGDIQNRVGFWIAELGNNRLGIGDSYARSASAGYVDGEWATIIKS